MVRLSVATIAVCSDADRGSPHVAACDEFVPIGGRLPSDGTTAMVLTNPRWTTK